MSDYLSHLVARSLTPAADIRPQIFSRYDPLPRNGGALWRQDAWSESSPEEPAPEGSPPAAPGPPAQNAGSGRKAQLEAFWRTAAETSRGPTQEAGTPVPVREGQPPTPRGARWPNEQPPGPASAEDDPRAARAAPPVFAGREAVTHPSPGREQAGPVSPRPDGALAEETSSQGTREHLAERLARLENEIGHSLRAGALDAPPGPVAAGPASREPVSAASVAPSPSPKAAPAAAVVPSRIVASPRILPTPARRERAEEAPSIHVTIGRVEIRATTPAEPRASRTRAPSTGPALDEYLRRRGKGGER